MKSLINRCFFAIIKANKQRLHEELTIQQINGCRQILQIRQNSNPVLQENCKAYINERIAIQSLLFPPSPELVFKRWQEIRPFESEVNILSFSNQLNEQVLKYTHIVVQFWGRFLLRQSSYNSTQGQKNYRLNNLLLDYEKGLNYLIYLVTPNRDNLFLYLKFSSRMKQLNISKSKHYSQLRYVFDKIMLLDYIPKKHIIDLIHFTSRLSLNFFYHEKYKEFNHFLFSKINLRQYLSQNNSFATKSLLYLLAHSVQPSMQLVQPLAQLLSTNADRILKFRIFILLCQVYIINKDNIRLPIYFNYLKSQFSHLTLQNWVELSRYFYCMDVWIEQFWLQYFRFMNSNGNVDRVQKLHHYIIYDLLIQGDGGDRLKEKAKQLRQLLLKRKNYDLIQTDVRKQLQSVYGDNEKSKFSCEVHVANSLRLICMGEVLVEVPVKYFLVDIMINKKIIIQVNNLAHYKVINGQKRLNLKSQFRERILIKAGYVCKNLQLEDYTDSNYMMMEEIYRIVEETTGLNPKMKKPTILNDSKQQ